MTRTRRRSFLVALVVAGLVGIATPGEGAVSADWPAYLYGASHSSYNAAATAITPANAGSLTQYWHWRPPVPTMTGQPPAGLFASPTVVGGHVYVGANSGVFYALDLATKRVLWSRFLGFVTAKTCGARGFTGTATVVPDASRGGQLTVYVAAADGYLYALNATDGTIVWRAVVALPSTTQNDYYNWGSPAVSAGTVYMGITSQCDHPLTRGGIKGYDQGTGALLGTYYSMAPGHVGGGIWSSVAVGAGQHVYGTTGTGRVDDAESIVRVSGTTLAREDAWQVPTKEAVTDSDFGASPTLFTATLNGIPTEMVAACNKNGLLYALRSQNLSAGPVWKFQTAKGTQFGQSSCLTAPVWDGARLFVAGPPTTIGGTSYSGSVRQLNPATGAVIWARGLNGIILGSPTLDGSGVLAAGTYDQDNTNSVYLLNSSNGNLLATIPTGSGQVFGQPVFADGYLLIPVDKGVGLLVYRP